MNTQLKCILLDDELPSLTYLKMLCGQIPNVEIVKAFNNPDILLNELPYLDFDLCILDIEMPQISGLQVANLLSGKPVIFTTAYKEYAADAFDLDAVDYVRKPIKIERLQQAIQKAVARLQKTQVLPSFMQLNTDKGRAVIYFEYILYIKSAESDSRDKIIYLSDGSDLLLKNISFEKLLESLPHNEFCRVNKKEIIALKTVQFFTSEEVTITIVNTDKIKKSLTLSIGDVYKNSFLQTLKV